MAQDNTTAQLQKPEKVELIDERLVKERKQRIKQILLECDERWKKGKYDILEKRILEIGEISVQEDFWSDQKRAKDLMTEDRNLRAQVLPWKKLRQEAQDALDLLEMAESEWDESTLREMVQESRRLDEEFDRIESLALLDREDDRFNAYITIHPGAGGTESQDWAEMLSRMYIRWAEENDYKVEILDYTPGDQAGIKSFTALISGENAYGLLKSENGVHRLVRISPFDANKRRHTSFASVYATPEVDDEIEIEIREEDLRIDTFRSSGAGGQHINTTDSAVRITHIPTNTVTQCQNERSQHKNKAQAMKMMRSALYQLEQQKLEEERLSKEAQKKDIAWGSQIRSYTFHPYNLVKDHRTGYESGNIQAMMDGELLGNFIYAFLKAKNLGQLVR